jgi:subfamily B ATP-binding cassette protein MsbA
MNQTAIPGRARKAHGERDFALIARLLRDYVGRQKFTLALAILCMLGGAITAALLAYIFDPMIKYLFVEKRADMVFLVPALAMGVVILRALFNYGEAVLMNAVGQHVVAGTQRDMAKSIFAFDLAELNAVHSGQFISNFLYDATLLRDAITKGVAACVKELLSLVLFAGLLIYQDWQLSLVSVLTLPIVAWITRNLGKSVRKASTRGMVETEGLSTTLSEILDGRRVVKAYGLEDYAVARAVSGIDQRVRYLIKAIRSSAISAPAADLVGGIALAIVFLIAGYQSINGQLEINAFASFTAAMLLAQQPVRNLSNFWTVTSSGLGAAKRVFALIDTNPAIVDRAGAKPLRIAAPPFGGNLRFADLRFAYHPGQPTLETVSFDVPAGKKIALVGPSGAGKSTLFNLLLRFYEPDSGRIDIDGQDITAVTLASLRGAIALVTQEAFLFDETIRANIGFGRAGASDEAIIAAAQAAAAHDFIAALPGGYDTRVGEGGLRLSGGQRQRIAIARAMLRDAPILLLDEATSALDTENERQVQDALKRLMKGRTTIVIAHRLTTVLDADVIHVLDGGRVVESGTHGELIARGGLYARLYSHEFKEDATAPAAHLG